MITDWWRLANRNHSLLHRIPEVVIQEVMSAWIPAAAVFRSAFHELLEVCMWKTKTERVLNLAKVLVWYPISHPAWWIVWPIPLKAVPLDCFVQEQKCNTRLSKQFAWPSSASEIDGVWLRIYDSYHSVCHVTGGTESRSWTSRFLSLANATTNFVRKPVVVLLYQGWCDVYLTIFVRAYIAWP